MKYTIFALIILLAACSSEPNDAQDTTIETMDTDSTTLQGQLNAKRADFNTKADSAKKQAYEEGIQAIVQAEITKNALQKGDKAPDFTLTNAKGKKVSLYKELKKGPVILLWYRGGWCPYCNLTLNAMQDMMPLFQAAGSELLALTPELPDRSLSTAEKNKLEFEVLTDLGLGVARKYGVVFKLTDAVKKYYEDGFGLSDYNGNNDGELPLGATYVIGTDGIITYAFLDADYRNRAEPMVILNALANTK
jgi:peroxiredoxin